MTASHSVMARRLVREEGIFAGGSSGSAVAGLLKSRLAGDLKAGQVAVVLLPDSGSRYLSTFFDDNWMRENGFLRDAKAEATVADVLARQPVISLVTVTAEARMTEVVGLMKQHEISQIPVVDEADRLVGVVTEVDLLDHLVHSNHVHDPQETIAPMVDPNVMSAAPQDKLERVLAAFERGKVITVTEGERPMGILTKIDVIDYLAGQLS